MQSVTMHVDGGGTLWAMTQCRVCGEVHKYLAAVVVSGPVCCKSCGRQMSLDGATVKAAYKAKDEGPPGDAMSPALLRRHPPGRPLDS